MRSTGCPSIYLRSCLGLLDDDRPKLGEESLHPVLITLFRIPGLADIIAIDIRQDPTSGSSATKPPLVEAPEFIIVFHHLILAAEQRGESQIIHDR